MFILANFVSAFAEILDYGLYYYMWIIIIRAWNIKDMPMAFINGRGFFQ